MNNDLISINEAVKKGITRLRLPVWKIPEDHLKINIINGRLGVWEHLFSPMNKAINGRDPVDVLTCGYTDLDDKEWLPYEGPLPESREYQDKVKIYMDTFKDKFEKYKT